jgi:hypothetical protein
MTAKVKDELNDDGTVKKACTADDLTAVGAKSRVTAVVNAEFSHQFNASVKWQKSDKTGTPIEDEDDATLDPDDQPGGGGNTGGGSGGNGGSDDDLEG